MGFIYLLGITHKEQSVKKLGKTNRKFEDRLKEYKICFSDCIV